MSGTDIVHIPYRGGAAAINDLIAGRVQLMFESLNSIAPHARSGTVRALAVTGERRSPGFPDVPTVAEAGVPGYAAPTWSGVIGPAGIPRPIVDKLNAAINRAINSPAFKERFAAIGDEPAGGTPGGLRRDDPEGFGEMARSGAALGGEVRLARGDLPRGEIHRVQPGRDGLGRRGLPKRKPCIECTPAARRNNCCSAVSTPSAVTFMPRPRPRLTIACTIEAASAAVSIERTNERSILMRSNGKRRR